MKRRRFLLLPLAAIAAGCGREPPAPRFHASDITGADWAQRLELTDHTGRRRTVADFRGKVVMVFFGFTHCPDACPTVLAEMAQALVPLGADSARVQVLFVTVDPERDSAEVLAKYVTAFHPSFLGLRGSAEETARAAKEFKIHYQAHHAAGGGAHYMVDHSTGIYVLDHAGRPRLYVSANGRTPERLAEDLKRLLAEAAG
jgi:protein SCO1/2